MATLSYVTNVSVDGYIEDAEGRFDWTEPDDDLFAFITDVVRPIGTWLYGRRLYEAMAVWETDPALAAQSDLFGDFAHVWQSGEKVVYSTSLPATFTGRARLERAFDPEVVREMKASATRGLTIGGATLAARAFDAGLVDECHLFVHPIVVGSGKAAFLGEDRVRLDLQDERRFENGVVYVRYGTRN